MTNSEILKIAIEKNINVFSELTLVDDWELIVTNKMASLYNAKAYSVQVMFYMTTVFKLGFENYIKERKLVELDGNFITRKDYEKITKALNKRKK